MLSKLYVMTFKPEELSLEDILIAINVLDSYSSQTYVSCKNRSVFNSGSQLFTTSYHLGTANCQRVSLLVEYLIDYC